MGTVLWKLTGWRGGSEVPQEPPESKRGSVSAEQELGWEKPGKFAQRRRLQAEPGTKVEEDSHSCLRLPGLRATPCG